MKSVIALAASALALSACAGGFPGDTVTLDRVRQNYEPVSVSVFAGGGGRATISGATRDGAGRDEIAAALRLPAFVSPRTVRAAPPDERPGGPHLALVIAPKNLVTFSSLCRGEAEGGVAGDELVVYGAFCSSYGTPVTEGRFTASGSPVPSDPDFGSRLSILMNELMPVSNPEWQGDGADCPRC